jgi:hypothetical protein
MIRHDEGDGNLVSRVVPLSCYPLPTLEVTTATSTHGCSDGNDDLGMGLRR